MMAKHLCLYNHFKASAGQLPALHPGRQVPAIGGSWSALHASLQILCRTDFAQGN